MIRRFFRSRGWRKLRSNRSAMVALFVIGLYVLLATAVVGSGLVAWAGKQTGWWELSPDSLAGILLLKSTEMRVGPEQLPGFGLAQKPEDKLDASLYLLEEVRKTLTQAHNAEDASPEEVLGRLHLAERHLSLTSVDDLQQAYDRFEQIKDQQNALEAAGGKLTQIKGDLDAIRTTIQARSAELARLEAQLAGAPAGGDDEIARLEDEALVAREEIAFSLYDLAEPISDVLAEVQRTGVVDETESETLADLLELIQTQAEAIELGEPGDGLGDFDPATIDTLESLIVDEPDRLNDASDTLRSQIIEIADELFPIPGGYNGMVYRLRLMFGTDRQGRSILIRALYSAKTAMQVGLVTAIVAVIFGSLLGAAGAFFGGWVDHAVIWLYSTFSSIPYLVLLSVIAFVVSSSDWTVPFTQTKVASTLLPLYAAFAMTFWIGPCRVIRGEAMKLKELEFVQAATAIGFSRGYILRRHIIPNTSHLMFINFSLLFIGAIKGEVILTFLGLGLKDGSSWGIMISQARPEVLNGFFWQIGAATLFMFILVLAFNILTDALQDAFDPKHV